MMIPGKKTEKIVDEKAVEKFIGKGKITEKPTVNPEVRTIKSAISSVLENGLTVKLD